MNLFTVGARVTNTKLLVAAINIILCITRAVRKEYRSSDNRAGVARLRCVQTDKTVTTRPDRRYCVAYTRVLLLRVYT